ncbi:phosphotransferase [Trujillonella endophytica]|uniref:Phosphotransferase enzyme family protein n=1 Tax=Trujillonella endophytica TaxID=673521 RepID=A0A1H8QML5_9ACTN|nr:phosphotransferase [Trujillella endophytica]SEO55063.1 Phosphotransferase enzyme family protein [Trujillella endophytica]
MTAVAATDEAPAIPATLAEALTPEWLTAALRTRFPDVVVQSVEPGPIVSRVSTNARFTITCTGAPADELPRELCIKGYFADMSSAGGGAAGFSEGLFFDSLAETTGVRTLRPVYAGIDPGTRESVVITEDVVARGATFLDSLSPYRPDQVAQSLEQFATLHASTWMDPTLGRQQWLTPSLPRILGGRGLPEIRHNFEGPIGAGAPDSVRNGERLIEAYTVVANNAATASPWAVIHGDAHVGNVFVDGEGRSCLVDWQLVQRGPWYVDVGYHIASTLPIEQRREHERDLLRHYLDRLAAGGVDRPDEDEAWRLIKHGIVHGFYLWAITQKVAPPITTELLTRIGAAVEDHDALTAVQG